MYLFGHVIQHLMDFSISSCPDSRLMRNICFIFANGGVSSAHRVQFLVRYVVDGNEAWGVRTTDVDSGGQKKWGHVIFQLERSLL